MIATRGSRAPRHLWTALLLMLLVIASSMGANAQYTSSAPAGTVIGNTATVTFTDEEDVTRTANSSAVYTYVQQINAFTLTPTSYTVSAVANEDVNIQYTLTNNSNGTDVIRLSLQNLAATDLTNAHIYPDNGSNAPNTAATDLNGQDVTVAQGGVYRFWVVGRISATPSNSGGQFQVLAIDQPAAITLPANVNQPAAYNTVASPLNGQGTVTVNITTAAVMNITKSFDVTSGPTGQTLNVTLQYTNAGFRTSGLVSILDDLSANGFNYVPGSAKWNGVAIADASGTSTVGGVTATWNYNTVTKQIAATLAGVPPSNGTLYNFTFQVQVAATAAGVYTNTAQYSYNDGGPLGGNQVPSSGTNPTSATYTLQQFYTATLATTSANPVATATSAQPIYFQERVTNTGNGTDSFVLSNVIGSFPTGTTFTYYVDNAGVPGAPLAAQSGVAGDPGATYTTGPVASGATYDYIIAVQVPAYTTSNGAYGNNGGAGYSFTASAAPQAGASAAVTVVDTLSAIALPVDLTTAATSGTPVFGAGPGPGASALVTSPGINPGTSYTFALFLKNNTTAADTFRVVASNTSTFGGTDTLPAGWSVAYHASANGTDCSTAGAVVANTNVAAGANGLVCAVVTVAGTQPQNASLPVYFQAISTTAPVVQDSVYDAIAVNELRLITVSSNAGNVHPGARIVLSNVITNAGNVAETVTFTGSFVTDNPTPGSTFTSELWQNYAANAVSNQITNGTSLVIAPGATVTIYARVLTNVTNAPGTQNVTTITVTYNGSQTAVGTDTVTTVAAPTTITVSKLQALDANCTGSGLTFGTTDVKAAPGQCVAYQITATNVSAAPVTGVFMIDPLSAYTTYCDGTAATCGASVLAGRWTATAGATESGATALNAGTLTSTTLNTIGAGASATFTFEVKIN